jgi:hypothetical protein
MEVEATKVRLEAVAYLPVPMVRIHFPPAESQTKPMPGEAGVVRPDVAAHAEAAAAQNNQERRYHEQSFHCLYPNLSRPRFRVYRLD